MNANDVGAVQVGQPAPHATSPQRGLLRHYLAIARFDHATKHVFILPGIVLAYVLRGPPLDHAAFSIVVGFISAISIASANYVINEWLDREFDALHPIKSGRTAVHWVLSPQIVYAEYAAFLAFGLFLASMLGTQFLITSALFVGSGLIYNIKPIRTKDRAYVDVLSESLNNPIRLILGWEMIDPTSLPPASLLIAYWSGGAFLMAAKRLSEYREISGNGNIDILHRYRRSFIAYTADSLTIYCFLCAMISAFFVAVFLIKYRVEYIFAFPFIAMLFAAYLALSLRKGSIAQRPERMFKSRRLVLSVTVTAVVLIILSFVDLPFLKYVSEPGFTPISKPYSHWLRQP